MSGQEHGSQKRADGVEKELVYVQPYPCRDDDDEISLVDLWLVLVKWKWWIMGITLLCLAAGLGYAFMQPVKFEYSTGIELARVHGGAMSKDSNMIFLNTGETDLLEDPDTTSSLLNSKIIPQQLGIFAEDDRETPAVQVSQKKGSNQTHSLLLTSVAEPKHADTVEDLHREVAEALVQEHASLLDQKIDVRTKTFEKRAAVLKDQIQSLQKDLQLLQERSGGSEKGSVEQVIQIQQKVELRRDLGQARLQLTDAQSAVEIIREASHPTRISFLAAESDEPVGPRKTLIVGLSLVLGLMLGVFAAFFREFLRKASVHP